MLWEHKKSLIYYIKKNEDRIRRSTNTSAPTSVNIFCVIHLEPLFDKMERTLCVWLGDEAWQGFLVTGVLGRKQAMQFHTTTTQSVGEEKGCSHASKHQLTPAATSPWKCHSIQELLHSLHLLQYLGCMWKDLYLCQWMLEVIKNILLHSKHHRTHGQTVQSLEWLLEEALAWSS